MANAQPQPTLSPPPPRAPVAIGTAKWDGGDNSPRTVIPSLVLGGLILLPLLLRASVNFNPLPYWDMDPLTFVPSITGLTPATSLVCDWVVMFASALALLRGAPTRLVLPAVAGATVCVWWHVTTVADVRLGTAWASGVLGAVALMSLCRLRPVRAALGAVLLGFILLLAAKGALQWFVEHPDSVAAFKRDRALVLSANGWEEGSSMARGYERRLMQQEASGWFGLSNVLATFGAAGVIAFGGLLIGAIRARVGPAALLSVALGLAASVGVLAMTGAKGALVACGLGAVAMAGLLWLATRDRRAARPIHARWASALAVGVPLLVVVAVCVRGLIGERLGELSVWFRWFYWQAAASVGAGGGCGPGGFQEAYLVAKPPISPEEVQSAHNAVMDWFAAFGWPAVLIVIVFLGLLWRAGRGVIDAARADVRSPEPRDDRASGWISGAITRTVLLTTALCTLAALYLDKAMMTEYTAAVRLGGMVVWMLAALGAAAVIRRGGALATAALTGAAVVLAAHGLFEVTGTNQQACGVWWAMLGVAAATAQRRPRSPMRLSGPGSIVAASIFTLLMSAGTAALAIMVLGTTALRASRVFTTERHLFAAAEACRPASELRAWLTAASRAANTAERDEALQRAREIVVRAGGDASDPARAMASVQRNSIDAAAPMLTAAYRSTGMWWYPREWVLLREHSRLLLTRATLKHSAGDLAGALIDAQAALDDFRGERATPTWTASAASWYATAALAAHALGVGGDLQTQAFDELADAQGRDPYNPSHAARRLKIAEEAGWTSQIPALARELLRLDDLQRLDRSVRGLSPAERAKVEALAKMP